MIETDGHWGDLEVDSYLRDRTGTAWRVCAIDRTTETSDRTGHLRLKNRDGEFVTLTPKLKTEVITILKIGNDDLIPLLRDRLGAQVIATQDNATKAVTCPPWPVDARGIPLDVWRGHLLLGHNIYAADLKTYKRLVEAHDHAHEHSKFTIEHTH